MVHFLNKCPEFGFDTVSGDHISDLKLGVEWNYAAFYGLAPEFGQNYEHFGQKYSEIGLTRS